MKKIILKKAYCYKLPETIFGIVISTAFLTLILFDILSGARKVSDSNLIGGFVFFGTCLIFYLWRLFAKKPQTHYININSREYRLFRKVSKWKFICINGFISSMRLGLIIAILFLSHLIKNEMPPFQVILIVIGACMIFTVPYGYMNYKSCASVDIDSDFTHPFYKK